MDDTRFDAWTRRRFGLATLWLGAALSGLIGLRDTGARKKRRRKRCRKLHQACQLGSKKKGCCHGLNCNDEADTASGLACCRDFQTPCDFENQCCNSLVCRPAEGLLGNRCCSTYGQPCGVMSDCCEGVGVFCNSLGNCSSPD